MQLPFDSSGDMHRKINFRFGPDPLSLDDETADRILNGSLAADDSPRSHVHVVHLLQAAAATRDVQPEDESQTLARLVQAMQPIPAVSQGERNMLGQLIRLKVAAVVAGAVLSMGGVAAAATNNLPSPTQDAVSDAVAHVGIDIPRSDDNAPHPGPETCEEARQVEDAKGCSAVAKAHAPGQNKATTSTTTVTTTSTTIADGSNTASSDDVVGDDKGKKDTTGKPAEPTKTGQEHQSSTGTEHSKGAENSEKAHKGSSDDSTKGKSESAKHGNETRGHSDKSDD
jgi:hypothetical protein